MIFLFAQSGISLGFDGVSLGFDDISFSVSKI